MGPKFREHHFVWLFFALMLFILLAAVAQGTYLLSGALYTVVLLAAVYGTIEKKNRWLPLVLGIPAISMIWLSRMFESDLLEIIADLVNIVFFFYIIAVVLRFIYRSKTVTSNVLFAGLSFYMLLGLVWVSIYFLVEEFYPGSFVGGSIVGASGNLVVSEVLYFSFVTLTTLGYGDISPVSPVARSVAVLEAIAGVLSLAILISRLVSAWKNED
jgi:hypothetical protein